MKYTLRAVLAVALLVGVYGLGLAVIIALGALVVFAFEEGLSTTALTKLVVFGGIAAIAIGRGLFSRMRTVDGEEPGVLLMPEQQPRLWATIRELAAQVGTRPPDEVRLVPDVNAAVAENARWLGLVGGRRRMYVGAPLLVGLTQRQMMAVLAHELGHYSDRHTALSGVTYRGAEAIQRVIARLGGDTLLAKLFSVYGKLYAAVSKTVTRRQELEADQYMAQIVGRRAAASALRELAPIDGAWGHFVEAYVSLGRSVRLRPQEVFGGFSAFLGEPVRQSQLERIRLNPPEHRPSRYDSHPSTEARVAAIMAVPGADDPDVSGPAIGLLDHPSEALRELESWMFDGSKLSPSAWQDMVARAGAERARSLAAALIRSVDEAHQTSTTLGTVLDELGEGRAETLVRPLVRDDAPDQAVVDAARDVMEHLVAAALIDAGQASYRLNWSGPWQLVDRDSRVLGVDALVDSAVTTRAGVAELERWLAARGVSREYRPSLEAVASTKEEVVDEPELVGALSGVSGKGIRFLFVLNAGLVLKKPSRGERMAAGLNAYTNPQAAMLRKALKGRAPSDLLSDPRSTFLPWHQITSVTVTKTVSRQPKFTIVAADGEERTVKSSVQTEVAGEPYAAMAHFLGERYMSAV